MIDHYSLVQHLTDRHPIADQARRLNDFAVELGWRPNDRLEIPGAGEFATAHLIVERGLEHSALISFLRQPHRFNDLTAFQQRVLVGSSYNTLLDWHIHIDYEGVAFLYNRYRPPAFHVVRENLSRTSASVLGSAAFQKIATSHPSPDVPALDRAVVQTISLWKRQIGGVFPEISNSDLSSLFNALIFIRTAEDHTRRLTESDSNSRLLLDNFTSSHSQLSLRAIVEAGLSKLQLSKTPPELIDLERLGIFDGLDQALVEELISDFYRNRFAKYYEYDFSLISKHALSRIYEHYVSLLRLPETNQLSLLPRMALESPERAYGNVYTPEYIAKFFARYLQTRLPLALFKRLRVIDPACGSGIFLRAIVELQNEALLNSRTTESVRTTLRNVVGIDVDPNACHAARLSLSLLSLVLLDVTCPSKLYHR